MKTFIIQKNALLEEETALKISIKYQKTFKQNNDFDYIIVSNISSLKIDNPHDYIPFGTIEFTNQFITKFYGNEYIPLPLNIPFIINDYAKRDIINISLTDNNRSHIICSLASLFTYDTHIDKIFVKSNDIIKFKNNGIHTIVDLLDIKLFPNGIYQISKLIDIKSEYRCFIYKDKLVGIKNYNGDFTIFPDINVINEIINKYKWDNGDGLAPEAYTLDIGVNDKDTFIIECHDFISVGLYGFNQYEILPFMYSHSWFNLVHKIQSI